MSKLSSMIVEADDYKKTKKRPACNEQFHESGGVDSYDIWCGTSSFALVSAFPNPPPS